MFLSKRKGKVQLVLLLEQWERVILGVCRNTTCGAIIHCSIDLISAEKCFVIFIWFYFECHWVVGLTKTKNNVILQILRMVKFSDAPLKVLSFRQSKQYIRSLAVKNGFCSWLNMYGWAQWMLCAILFYVSVRRCTDPLPPDRPTNLSFC